MDKQQSQEQLRDYYSALPRKDRYYARCVMHLPQDLEGKRVLDLECRRGKGVYAISDLIGQTGFVVGMDSSTSHIIQAREAAPNNYRNKGCWSDRLSFVQGYFEDLQGSGIDKGSIDVIIVNSVLNLSYNLKQALHEIHNSLSSDGYLYHSNIFTKTPIPSDIAKNLRLEGNVFGAALTIDVYESHLKSTGFSACSFSEAIPTRLSGLDEVKSLHGYNFVEVIVKAYK